METASGHRLADFVDRLVGFELENQLLDRNGDPVAFASMQQLWSGFAPLGWRFRKDPAFGVISGAEKRFTGGTVMLTSDTSAGNLEVVLPPTPTVDGAEQLRQAVFDDVLAVTAANDVRVCALGMHPGRFADLDGVRLRSSLYWALEEIGGSTWFNNGVSIPLSANQAGVSVKPAEAISAVNRITAVTGLVVALCANAAISGWRPLPWKEWRILAWEFRFIGPTAGFERLSAFPPRPFKDLADYFRHYWQVPHMILPPIREDGWVVPDQKLTPLSYLAHRRTAGRDARGNAVVLIPSVADINLAMISMWPFAKLHLVLDETKATVADFTAALSHGALEDYLDGKLTNSYLECRAAAATPTDEEATVPALFLGLINNPEGLADLVAHCDWDTWRRLVHHAARHGANVEMDGRPVTPLLERLLQVAEEGLTARGKGEERFLEPLHRRVSECQCPADKALAALGEGKKALLNYATYHQQAFS